MIEHSQVLAAKGLNVDTHPSLVKEEDLYYLLNGDVQGKEGGESWFVQNQLGNDLCFQFPENYYLNGHIMLNNFEYVLFFCILDPLNEENVVDSEIGILNTEFCSYTKYVSDPCLGFRKDKPVRGKYKHSNKENDREIYFIDGWNDDRFLVLKEDGSYPKVHIGSKCDSCDYEEGETLDCNALRVNKQFNVPCLTLEPNLQGQLASGVYQAAIAFSDGENVFTDYYFSPAVKVWSEGSNIGLNLNISCIDSPFDYFSLILLTRTQESSLVVYRIGHYPLSNTTVSITNFENSTIISTEEAVTKTPIYDGSEHIETNGETLIKGKFRSEEILNYQPLANNIVVRWVEIKVPKEKAHLYPSFMRDEVYSINIEWYSRKAKSKGRFHIPGRVAEADDLIEYTADDYATNDIYEIKDCVGATLKKWQIENTASILNEYEVECKDCSGDVISKDGKMGYWEAENLTYPNTEMWGSLACQKIRHHRMPSHNLTHIHDNFTTQTIPANPEDCETINLPGGFSYEVCPSEQNIINEPECVNVLAIKLYNIEHPKKQNGDYDDDINGYRILIGDRNGNKTILHKGLLYNVWKDTSTEKVEILYPNYPFNDLNPDLFLSVIQNADNSTGSVPPPNGNYPKSYARDQFTYHSPDIHFRETRQEFGTELKVYGEEIGYIFGDFKDVYQHPQVKLGLGDTSGFAYGNYATQVNSVANYSKFEPLPNSFDLKSRFQIRTSQYLVPVNQLLSNGKKFNNWLRESSYYINLNRNLDDPQNMDVSRVFATEFGYLGTSSLPSYNYFNTVNRVVGGTDVPKNIQSVSYYGAVKIKQPDQYGSLDQILYRPVSCIKYVKLVSPPTPVYYVSDIIYGGDVYITKHSVLRKMPLFTQWLTDVPITTEYNYRNYRNVWYPRNWYDNQSQANDQYNLDGQDDVTSGPNKVTYGKFYVFVTGVAYFYCESEFIGDFREQDFTINGQFYPKIDYNDIARSDKIPYDNKFLYNFILLNNEVERVTQDLTPTKSDNDFLVIYSRKDDFQNAGNPWLSFPPLNYTLLPRTYGKFTGMHYTDQYSLFFAFENEILYSQINFNLTTNQGNSILLNQGDIFTNRLVKLSNEQSGYVGCVDPRSFVNTRYGTFFIDRYRKKLFKWNGQLEDVTGTMESWLNHYLNSDLPDYFTSLTAVFDNYTNNLYLSERSSRDNWTISYKPIINRFISFHSFLPEYYFSLPNSYMSSDFTGIWKHNKQGLYQSYYGVVYPFDIGLIINNGFKKQEYQSFELFSEWIKYTNFNEAIYVKNKFFDKIFAYNNNGSTGWMQVFLKDKNKRQDSLVQNAEANPIITEVSLVNDSVFRFNKFENIKPDTNTPSIQWSDSGVYYTPINVDPLINPRNRSDLKGSWLKLHFNVVNSEYKILSQLILPQVDNTTG